MSVTINTGWMKYKNPNSGEYQGIDAITDASTEDRIAAINSAGATQIAAVEAKGAETRGSIPANYSTLSNKVNALEDVISEVRAPTDEQVAEAMRDWLDDHPEATTTVQDGSITEDKLANDVKAIIDAAAHSAPMLPSNLVQCGHFFEKPEGLNYCGWPYNNIQYDSSLNKIVFLVNARPRHETTEGYDYLCMGKMDMETYSVSELVKIGDPAVTGHGYYTMGFCIDDEGNYWYTGWWVNTTSGSVIGKSTDKGATWTETSIFDSIECAEAITQLSNGRFLLFDDWGGHEAVWYSDDDCVTWTKATMSNTKKEASFLELPDDDGTYSGKVICFMRKTISGTDTGDWQGNKIIEPIHVSYSTNYGTTWTAAKASSTLTTGTANVATGFYHAKEDLVEVFASPRYPYKPGTYGALYQYITTREKALADDFGAPKLVTYAKAVNYSDFGHIGGCMDRDGDLHLMYYDGDSNVSGTANYNYIKASRKQAALPTHHDNDSSVFLPYSGVKTDAQIARVRIELLTKINQIIIDGGGTIDDDMDGSFYVTNGLYEAFDLMNQSKYDASTRSQTGLNGNFIMKRSANFYNDSAPSDTSFSAWADICWRAASFNFSSITVANGYSIEFIMHNDSPTLAGDTSKSLNVVDSTNNYGRLFYFRPDGYNYGYYTNTSSETTGYAIYKSMTNTQKRPAAAGKEYTHNVVICNSDGVFIYQDGALNQKMVYANIADYSALAYNSLQGLNFWNHSGYYHLTKLRLYNKSLSEAEVKNNYKYESSLF